MNTITIHTTNVTMENLKQNLSVSPTSEAKAFILLVARFSFAISSSLIAVSLFARTNKERSGSVDNKRLTYVVASADKEMAG